jgi:ABC-type sugar transport system ATPase subunit
MKPACSWKHLGLDIDPETPLKYLSIGQWQMVEIAKALARNAKIIAFDEPTSSLSAREIENLFRVIRELRQEGRVIIYVSHRMEEIFALSDAITVFKDGRYVRTFDDMQRLTMTRWFRRWSGASWAISTAGRVSMAKSVCAWSRSKRRRAHAGQPFGAQRRNRRPVWAGWRRAQRTDERLVRRHPNNRRSGVYRRAGH